MTSLVPVDAPTQDLDLSGSVADVLRRLSASKAVAEPETPAGALERVHVSKKALEALDKLSGLLTSIEFPTEARELTETERSQYMVLASESKEAQKALESAVEAVKQAIFDEFDLNLLKDQTEEELADRKDPEHGWYLVEDEKIVDGKRFTREIAESQPQLSASALKKLWQEDKLISRADYYAMTVPQDARTFDGDKFLAHLKKKPTLIATLADVIVPGKMTARFWVRALKKGQK
jgi:hypothetical protein